MHVEEVHAMSRVLFASRSYIGIEAVAVFDAFGRILWPHDAGLLHREECWVVNE